MNSQSFFDGLSSIAPRALFWLLAAAIVLTIFQCSHSLLNPKALEISPTTQASKKTSNIKKQPIEQVNIEAVVSRNLFGKPVTQMSAQAQLVAKAAETRLPLELRAVFESSESSSSAAIIGQRGQNAKLFTVGDSVPGNAILEGVVDDKVLLRRAGKLEFLPFPESKYQATQNQKARASTNQNKNEQLVISSDAGKQTPITDILETIEAQAPTAESSTEPVLLREFKENPQEMISKIGLSETKSGGYRVGNVSNSPYLRQSGLQSGDVILSVNGQTLSNVQNDRTQLAGLMAGGTARLEIQRGDIRFTITASMPNSG